VGVTSYLVVGGEILSETRNGVKSDYIPDPLGSTSALINSSGTITDTFIYWPYGQVRTHVGSSVTPFVYVGTAGYYTDVISGRLYIRARFFRPSLTRWQTLDPLWPRERPFLYTAARPTVGVDPSGLQMKPRPVGLGPFPPAGPTPAWPITCGEPWNSWIYNYCNNCYYGSDGQWGGGGILMPTCQDTCGNLAGQYYNNCGKPGQFPSRYPPTGFRPTSPGGPVLPVRPGAPQPPSMTSAPPPCPPPPDCLNSNVDLKHNFFNFPGCMSCCNSLPSASVSGCQSGCRWMESLYIQYYGNQFYQPKGRMRAE